MFLIFKEIKHITFYHLRFTMGGTIKKNNAMHATDIIMPYTISSDSK